MEDRKVDLRILREPGTYPSVEEKATLELARAIHRAESTDVSTSWSAQERAMEFANSHTLGETLDEMFRLEKLALPGAKA